MTVNQLYKRLGLIIGQGHGRRQVCVAKDTFQDNRESDGCTILQVEGMGVEYIHMADDDGGTAINKDGSERMRDTCILVGSAGANRKGVIVSLG